jgi:hypothetical protein
VLVWVIICGNKHTVRADGDCGGESRAEGSVERRAGGALICTMTGVSASETFLPGMNLLRLEKK